MKEWEYKVLVMPLTATGEDEEKMLNERRLHEWELVSVMKRKKAVYFYFKRRREPV